MYVNKIDETIDIFIDDFYNKVVLTEIVKYYDESNFVKYQKDINKIFANYFETIDKKIINDILNNEDNTEKLIELVKKYIGYYTILTIGFFYKGKYELFMNNVIEFSKNQHGFNLKIDNFFNSESNSLIFKFYQITKNILTILDADSVKLSQIVKKKDFKETIDFLNFFGQDYVNENFKLKNLNGKLNDQAHNIIKTIIINEIYVKQDKQNVHMLLDQSEIITGQFIYIDVVRQTNEVIDYAMIESVLSPTEIERGFASEIYDLITEYDAYKIQTFTHEQKIIDLLDNKFVIPISEDFMLYHKDSENYDKYIGKLTLTSRKKDEPKIKYIVNKIESLTEYYFEGNSSEKQESIKKLFDPLLDDRFGSVINHIEDCKIIQKLELSGVRAIESNEYYNDLKNFMKYPYINFKNFNKDGFPITTLKSLDVIRSISFDIKQTNRPLQIRSSNPHNILNIVGFIIPNKNYDIKCAKINDIINIRNIKYKKTKKSIKNGYDIALNIINHNITKSDLPHVYWEFDVNKDKVIFENYDMTEKISNVEQVKMIAVKLYNDIVSSIRGNIFNNLENKTITMQQFTKYMNKINNNVLDISKNKEMYDEIIKNIYLNNLAKYEDKYDIKSDIFTGLTGDVIMLPTYKPIKKSKIEVITLAKNLDILRKSTQNLDSQLTNAICQHNITFDNLMSLRKKEPNKFNDMLFTFFLQYVEKTYDGQYICKSCSSLVNIGNFVQEGSYDDEGHFLSFNVTINVPLEDIPEYEKYKSSIRNLGKIVERFASIFKINTLIGSSNSIKIKIRQIVKDTIDLLLIHNINLKQTYKQRSENLISYGINKDFTNLFTFELDNSIFVYSSKDKDYYKSIKKNNIYIYIIFFILLELSDTQLYYMMGDKVCNYYLFSKFGLNLFDGLNIKKGKDSTMTPITNYKVLCYVLFYISCLMTKYNLWFYDKADGTKKFNPTIQKIIIHTFVDFLNSVIEIYNSKNKKYIYDVIVNKFFQKLNGMFTNNFILEKIKMLEEKKVGDKKSKFSLTQNEAILLQNTYEMGTYFEDAFFLTQKFCKVAKSYISKYIKHTKNYYEISDVTNCETGTFHKWTFKGGEYVCTLCGRSALTKQGTIPKSIIKINNYTNTLSKIVSKYCDTGETHNCIDGKCITCKQDVNTEKKSTLKQMEKIYDLVKNLKNKDKQVITKNDTKEEFNKNFINALKKEYGSTKSHKEDYFKFIDNFITKIEAIIGKDYNVSGQNIFLKYDSYIIDHDHNGFKLDKPILIINSNDKIIFKQNHPFFKTDVFYYTNNKLELDIYYDSFTKTLLGYKEKNKGHQLSKKHNVNIKINYSIASMIKLFGYNSKIINISDRMAEYEIDNKNEILENVVADIGRDRITSLKKILTDLQKYIYRFAYNYYGNNINEENAFTFIEKYKDKVNKIILQKSEGKKFLYKWTIVKDNIFLESMHNKIINHDPNNEFINADIISNNDYSGNLILFYMISEITKLLDINDDKFNKVNLAHLLLDMIVTFHFESDKDTLFENEEIKRFSYVLASIDYSGLSNDYIEGYYSEYKDPMEEVPEEVIELIQDNIEEQEALDMEDNDGEFEETNRDFGGGDD